MQRVMQTRVMTVALLSLTVVLFGAACSTTPTNTNTNTGNTITATPSPTARSRWTQALILARRTFGVT